MQEQRKEPADTMIEMIQSDQEMENKLEKQTNSNMWAYNKRPTLPVIGVLEGEEKEDWLKTH